MSIHTILLCFLALLVGYGFIPPKHVEIGWMEAEDFVNDWRAFGALNDKRVFIGMPLENDWPENAHKGIEILVGVLEQYAQYGLLKYRHTNRPYTRHDRDELVKWLQSLDYNSQEAAEEALRKLSGGILG